jgi:N utilization substance protein B
MTALNPLAEQNQHKRSIARINAVQALYQLRMSADRVTESVVSEFRDHRLVASNDPERIGDADEKHFSKIVEGVNSRVEEIDALIVSVLRDDWKIERLEHTLLSILRAGVYEIIDCPDIPVAVIVNEYVEVAKAFYEDKEAGFVNGILDGLAKKCRA